ncbi:MAG: prolyl oligopeptidase family serine peptidase [Gemmatales bacterium]
MDPGFSVSALSLLDRGVAIATAHIRGGGELGRAWYEGGRLLNKRNTFTDFIAVARHLIETGWTTPGQLVADGGSAGGLLMGAVANMAPELFGGILAAVPFVDPLTSILDPSLPLTVTEWEEWGDPLHDAQVYSYIRGYSPYENVAPRPYPAMLILNSLNDTRVLFTEAAEWEQACRRGDDVGRPDPAAHRDEGRPRRGVGAVQAVGGGGLRARLDPPPFRSRPPLIEPPLTEPPR